MRRIITIGTPHRGSYFANDVTRYLGEQLISLPEAMTARLRKLRTQNPGFFRDTSICWTPPRVSIRSRRMPRFCRCCWRRNVRRGLNITTSSAGCRTTIGRSACFGDGDGVVPYTSAHLADADSEIEVPADHDEVHRHPQTILQVREILAEHLREVKESYPAVDIQMVQRDAAVQR